MDTIVIKLIYPTQCQVGLRWLQQGRIEGIIFMENTVMDMGFESVEWTREWIQQIGSTKL